MRKTPYLITLRPPVKFRLSNDDGDVAEFSGESDLVGGGQGKPGWTPQPEKPAPFPWALAVVCAGVFAVLVVVMRGVR